MQYEIQKASAQDLVGYKCLVTTLTWNISLKQRKRQQLIQCNDFANQQELLCLIYWVNWAIVDIYVCTEKN